MGYYSAIKRNGLFLQATTKIKRKCIVHISESVHTVWLHFYATRKGEAINDERQQWLPGVKDGERA